MPTTVIRSCLGSATEQSAIEVSVPPLFMTNIACQMHPDDRAKRPNRHRNVIVSKDSDRFLVQHEPHRRIYANIHEVVIKPEIESFTLQRILLPGRGSMTSSRMPPRA